LPIDYSQLIKKLRLPPGFLAPTRLTYEDVVASSWLAGRARSVTIS
jgi:hypothetical protein